MLWRDHASDSDEDSALLDFGDLFSSMISNNRLIKLGFGSNDMSNLLHKIKSYYFFDLFKSLLAFSNDLH